LPRRTHFWGNEESLPRRGTANHRHGEGEILDWDAQLDV
jgi:hypothetical protein